MSIVVTGYASLDYAVQLDLPALPDRTSTILSRAAEWPRLGGSPAYVAAALVAGRARDAAPVSWVGDDAEGARYRDSLEALGVRTDGIGVRPGRTPICILAYQPDDRCHCLYDPRAHRAVGSGWAAARPAGRGGGGLRHRGADDGDPGGAPPCAFRGHVGLGGEGGSPRRPA